MKKTTAAAPSFDAFTALTPQAFKDGIEKSVAGLNDVAANAKRNAEAFQASVTVAAKGAEALRDEATAYSKGAYDAGLGHAKALTSARSLQEAVELQTAYSKTAMEAFLKQVNVASELFSTTVRESTRPLSERATALAEQVQAGR
jgi:phasin family protein